ncbi:MULTISPECIES: DUF1330 domain-containing protein [unclassified Crossiella]|uniref:DUF1330 domain-containing protein n=1 Tax=unclassified Crossiella TaxID=2620835 RepID=UPI001FFF38AD|nr:MULTISPECIES: DUF1330 domain-containing protein [unclassified Crossiella]MCK2239483.1 DUF1330 domain-containing protein [Crossiella sp. S99.2]MCK2252178.1 DUF1330 domain-containing protein [Crossiella sp. S99.1]
MTVYVLAQFTITDLAAYGRYQARFLEVFAGHRGTLLAADDSPAAVEGEYPHQKAVLISFPDQDAFREWSQSPAYQEISRDRQAGTDGVVVLLDGIGP